MTLTGSVSPVAFCTTGSYESVSVCSELVVVGEAYVDAHKDVVLLITLLLARVNSVKVSLEYRTFSSPMVNFPVVTSLASANACSF